MGINTDLNVDPYYDDFSEAKQFNRILFKPAKAVQARELTQLQTILQKQVERFGSNIYKEGTVISGINVTARPDIFYVKLNDQSNFTDPTLYGETDQVTYTVTGRASGLVAEIIKGENGFQTQNPDLKTFYMNYIGYDTTTSTTDVKEFQQGELLDIKVFKVADANAATLYGSVGTTITTVTVATVAAHAGRSFGLTCEEGVLYQKGHFIFVNSQFVVVSKYSNTPGNVSAGFTINENIITSGIDSTLLDNAAGFNNENAPGADRLKLVPTLVSYNTASEPTEFFALIRYVDGNAVRIRDKTEFNSISSEMARRTYDESGNYVTKGMNVTLEQSGSDAYAVVSPGKAYVFGTEVQNIASRKLLIAPTTLTQSKTNQFTGVSYGQYYTFNPAAGQEIDHFDLNGSRFNLKNSSNAIIGSCSISNITPGKVYVYAVTKTAGQENTAVAKIENTPLTNSGALYGTNSGGKLFDAGKTSMSSMTDVKYTKRMRLAIDASEDATITLSATATEQPLGNSSIFAVDASNNMITATSTVVGNDVNVTLSSGTAQFLYYDAIVSGTDEDGLQELDVYVKSTFNSGIATIGLPNAIQLLEVIDQDGAGANVTGKFRLVNNQKDNFYGISYLTPKLGETISNNALRIKVKVLKRTSTQGSGYITVDSYSTLASKNLVKDFVGKNGIVYNLVNCFDFRPYSTPLVSYSVGVAGAPSASVSGTTVVPGIQIANESTISATHAYYMSRVDSVVIDELGGISLYQGGEAENPSIPTLQGLYAINNIFVPGNTTAITGNNSLKINDVSNKNYTMKEIAGIEERIDRLTNLVSLSMLELDAKSIFIPDGSGNDRFKNGILVDGFKGLQIADITDPEFKAGVDKTRTVATPSVTQFPIDLKVGASTGANTFQDIITLADTGTRVTVIDQPYATSFRNCVSNFYNYAGKTSIEPAFDSGYDVVQNPAINLEIDLATPILDLLDNLQEIIPLTRESTDTTVVTAATRRAAGEGNVATTTTSLTNETSRFTESVGNFVTDVTMKPYASSKEIKILVTGLRPNTRHYFYFQGDSVDAHVYPASVNPTVVGSGTEYNVADVEINGTLGASVRTDSEGTLTAVFFLPESTYWVGENTLEITDVSSYINISSAKTSYTKAVYRAYNFAIGKSELSTTTRTVDFDTEDSIVNRSFQIPRINGDPIAQTFVVRASQAAGASVSFVSSLDLFFNKKSATVGVTVEIREVINGYPSKAVLPFARKHLRSNQVNVSTTGTTATTVTFKNPVKLQVEKEYAFVVIPDQNSPDYLIYTSKVGNPDLATGTAITNDWGDGVLFTSTNDSAWKSYQDEDIKFTLKRYQFQSTAGSVDLEPNDVEFLTVSGTTNNFKNDELVYVKKTTQYPAGVNGRALTILGGSGFSIGDYVFIESGTNTFLSEIVGAINSGQDLTLRTPYNGAVTTAATAFFAVAGRVSYFNSRTATRLFLRKSSATATNLLAATEVITGYTSGAYATIASIDNEELSYFQPQVFTNNSIKTSTSLTLYNGSQIDKTIPSNGNVYTTNLARNIKSKSNIVNASLSDTQDFKIRVAMNNSSFQSATPIVDSDLSMLNVYKYNIANTAALSSAWVTKEVVLAEQLDASGLKVLLSAFRPAGTFVDVYARFVYPTNVEVKSAWTLLTNSNLDLYSNPSNTKDYREFEYTLPSETNEYSTFQLKIVLRHATTAEINATDITVVPAANLFPHIFDYRAIALT